MVMILIVPVLPSGLQTGRGLSSVAPPLAFGYPRPHPRLHNEVLNPSCLGSPVHDTKGTWLVDNDNLDEPNDPWENPDLMTKRCRPTVSSRARAFASNPLVIVQPPSGDDVRYEPQHDYSPSSSDPESRLVGLLDGGGTWGQRQVVPLSIKCLMSH
jgi:hypothetical protein